MNRNARSKSEHYAALLMRHPDAYAEIKGSAEYPQIYGAVRWYQITNGVLIAAEINGLPYSHENCGNPVFGFHIHAGTQCEGDLHDPFSSAMSHYNPSGCPHPFHAGDLPPLFGNHGYAFSAFVTDRFALSEVIGKTVILHGNPDDFTSQPSGNAGQKLACGRITACKYGCKIC